MEKIIVSGGKPLSGHIRVSGSKNAALPLIFASLLVPGKTVLYNVPDIGDVSVALEIISSFGAGINRLGDRFTIDASKLSYAPPEPNLISKIRASTYLIGASLARFGIADIGEFGGCNFSLRPIDFHLMAAEAMGAKIEGNRIRSSGLHGAKIHLPKPSVGATINAAIMAASADGETEIFGYAKEPHVLSVLNFLSAIGVSVSVSDSSIKIKSATLRSAEFTVIGDMIEAGTYLAIALMTGGKITVSGVNPSELSAFTSSLIRMGCVIETENDSITANSRIKNEAESKNIFINASPYPGFPTDLQPIIVPLLSVRGGGIVNDTVWRERFGYLESLSKMGLDYKVGNGCAHIYKSNLHSAAVTAPDLRGGMAILMSAISSDGVSEILSPEIILRGYDHLIEKLSSLGADVKLIKM